MALGRQGCGRAEIGPALGLEMAELAAREAGDADFARAMRLAAEAERAWWEGQPRAALTAGARLDFGAWREAMRWRFGAGQAATDAAAGTPEAAGRAQAEAAAQPARPLATYYIPDNLRQRRLADGTPITPEMRRERAIAQAQPFLAAAERRMARAEEALAQAQEELEEWREEMRDVEARDYDPDAEEDDEDWDGEDGWNEEDESDDDDEGDERDGEGDDADGDSADGGAGDPLPLAPGGESPPPGGGGEGAGDPLPLAPGGESPPAAFSGGREGGDDGRRVSDGAAGCEWAVPAGVAGPPAWAAQPDFGTGDAAPAEGLRGRLR